jgi:hypothetical protein
MRLIKAYAERSPNEDRYWMASNKDNLFGRKSRYDTLSGRALRSFRAHRTVCHAHLT